MTGASKRKDAPGSSNILGALMSGKGLEDLTEKKTQAPLFAQEDESETQGDVLKQKAL